MLKGLGRVPEPPTICKHVENENASTRYELSLRTERHLVSTLATLSSIDRTATEITAVCVQEEAVGLNILIAANASSSMKSEYLNRVKNGFDTMFNLLRNASTG